MVRIHLAMAEVPRPFDAADALAVALCHARRRRIAAPDAPGRPEILLPRRRGSSRAAFAALAAEYLARRR
jgi:hypothetical protein